MPKIPTHDFWTQKTAEEIVREQGKKPFTEETFRELVKLGKELFPKPGDLDEFVKGIYERRRRGRES